MFVHFRMLSKMIFTFWVMLLTHNVLATENVITINQSGSDTLECCVDGKCPCSNLSLAFIHIQDNTEIRITSDIPLHHDVEFGNISSIIIIGYNNPTIMCGHQGGLVGNYIKQIKIQNITWDKCNGIILYGFTDAYITDCGFQYSTNFALTLNGFGSIHINGTSFSYNNGGVDALAPSVIVYNSNFNDTTKYEALHVNTTTESDIIVTVISCSFTNNSGYGVNIVGNRFTPSLLISSCNFTNNTNSSVVGDNVDITLLHNVTFYNNVVVDTSGKLSADGAAIKVYNSTVSVNGTVMFCNNKAGNNGGAVYLLYSNITTTEGIVIFYNNSASNGGAVYVGRESNFYTTRTLLQFKDNTATSNGGAFYVDIFNEIVEQIVHHYHSLLTAPNDFVRNIANGMESNAYFNMEQAFCDRYYFYENTFSSSTFNIIPNHKSYVTINSSNFTCTNDECQVEFRSHDIHNIGIKIFDCFRNSISPTVYSCSVSCSPSISSYNYDCLIDSSNNIRIFSNDTIVKCYLNEDDYIDIDIGLEVNDYYSGSYWVVAVHWNKQLGNCSNDIAHVASRHHGCLPISCDLLHYTGNVPEGLDCLHDQYDPYYAYNIIPGYWIDNGFKKYVHSCPANLCNHDFDLNEAIELQEILPDSNYQCNQYWTGLACGECDSSKYSILYDTENCVHLGKCHLHSFASNFLLLLCVSFAYWCLILFLVFVLLHFQFDVTAGYAYSVIFYYSILEVLANMFYALSHTDYCWDGILNSIDEIVQVLSVFSNIVNLRPPFLRYLGLCLHQTEIIDHVYLTYLHSLIVTVLIALIFVTARRYVAVARYIGRYVNSKSICLLLLLSYSSVCYTSIQLLKPLAVYYVSGVFYPGYTHLVWHTYLSPGVKYFHGRHILYGIIAILCELIIGIGLPLVILTQRYLIRYFNLKLISIKPVIDQLQGCYKEEYRWFAAYYLICRQVIYGTDIVTQFLSVNPSSNIIMVCILMLAIHLWFQPYKKRSLNFFDSIILLILIVVAFSGFFGGGLCTGTVLVCSVLPIICLVNYLALSSKLKHISIPISCGSMIAIVYLFAMDTTLRFFLFTLCSIIFLAYTIFVLKCIYVKIQERKVKYVMIGEQHFDINEDSEDDSSDEP